MLDKEYILKKLAEIDKNEFGFKSIGLFGSFSRDEQTPDSDIDILVEMDIFPETPYPKSSYFRLFDLKKHLEEIFGKEVDLIDKSQFKYEYKCPEVREYKEKIKREILESVIYV